MLKDLAPDGTELFAVTASGAVGEARIVAALSPKVTAELVEQVGFEDGD